MGGASHVNLPIHSLQSLLPVADDEKDRRKRSCSSRLTDHGPWGITLGTVCRREKDRSL